MNRSARCGQLRKSPHRPRKKTDETIYKETTGQLDNLPRVIRGDRRKTEHFDLEAIEMAMRSAMHRPGQPP